MSEDEAALEALRKAEERSLGYKNRFKAWGQGAALKRHDLERRANKYLKRDAVPLTKSDKRTIEMIERKKKRLENYRLRGFWRG